MITGNKCEIIMEFGNGDIAVGHGHMSPRISTEKKIVFVGYKNQTPRAIGSPGEIIYKNEDVKMVFTCKESIDVVINALNEARKYLE